MAVKSATPFMGATWDQDVTIGCDKLAEMGVLFLLMTLQDQAEIDAILAKFHERDFCYSDCMFVFRELKLAYDSGIPTNDKSALSAWFARPDVIRRAQEAKLDWTHPDGTPAVASFVLNMMQDSNWASYANIEYYFNRLRSLRVTRGCRTLMWNFASVLNEEPDNPKDALEYLGKKKAELDTLVDTVGTWKEVLDEANSLEAGQQEAGSTQC